MGRPARAALTLLASVLLLSVLAGARASVDEVSCAACDATAPWDGALCLICAHCLRLEHTVHGIAAYGAGRCTCERVFVLCFGCRPFTQSSKRSMWKSTSAS